MEMHLSRRLGRASLILSVAVASTSCRDHPTQAAADWLACERFAFPCTFAEVDAEVLRRSLAVGEEAASRIRTETPSAVGAWLRSQSGVVEVAEWDGTLAFRLEGGRWIWLRSELLGGTSATAHATDPADPSVGGPHREQALAALLERARRWHASPKMLYAQEPPGSWRRGGVVGVDQDGDGKITQHDPRRALILVPDPHHYLDEAHVVQVLLEDTPGYDFVGSIDLRPGPMAGVDAFRSWDGFDLVHVAASSVTVCRDDPGWMHPADADSVTADNCVVMVATGTVVDPTELKGRTPTEAGDTPNSDDPADRPELQAWVNSQGLEVFGVVNAVGELEWRLFAARRFFRDAYPAGVRRALVFLNISNQWGLTALGDVLVGSPARSTVVMWRSGRSVQEAWDLATTFYTAASEGWAPHDVFEEFLGDVQCAGPSGPLCKASAKVDMDLRVREVVEVRAASSDLEPPLLVDGQALESLMDDALALEPTLDFNVDVYGIMPEDEDILVRVELDGEQIAERSVVEADEEIDGHILRLWFQDVPFDPEVQDGEEHELEAILSLPRGGESRYAARLKTIDRQCYWEVDVAGPITGHFEGTGIRLRLGDAFSLLQLDKGVSPTTDEFWAEVPVAGVSLGLGAPPTQGLNDSGEMGVVLSADIGIPFTIADTWSVHLTSLVTDSTGQPSTLAGTFDAEFSGAFIDKKVVRQHMTARGRFIGNLSGPHGCGPETFRWYVNATGRNGS